MYRKQYITVILLTMLIWDTISVKAQEVVLRGSTHRYSITSVGTNANYKYTWAASGGTSSEFGFKSTSEPIVWDGPPGLYSISMFPTDVRNGCAGNVQKIEVEVVDFPVHWQGISTTICSSWGNEFRDFSLVVEFPATTSSWSFEYQIDNTPAIKVTVTGGTVKILNISGFINHAAAGVEIHKVRITRIVLPNGRQFTFDGTELDAAGHLHIVTVNPLPPQGKIEFVRDLE